MKSIKPQVFVPKIDGITMLKKIEAYGRLCHKSEDKITDHSYKEFIEKIVRIKKHVSIIEHESVTVRIICDRGVTHELVRHRIASYSQESTRYCNYSKDKFDNQITVIDLEQGMVLDGKLQLHAYPQILSVWANAMADAETAYNKMIGLGAPAQIARSVLPNSLKTEIVVTFNLREWHHFFILRTAAAAHPQMREITIPLLVHFQSVIPIIFDNIPVIGPYHMETIVIAG